MSLRAGMEDEELPSMWRSLVQAMRLAYRAEPKLLVISFVLVTAAWLPDAFSALWLKMLIDGVADHRSDRSPGPRSVWPTAAAAGWLLRTIGNRVEMRFRDRATIEVEAHVANLQASVAGIEHHERPEYLDRLQLLREQVFLLNHIYSSLMGSIGSIGRLLITLALLASIHPSLVLLGVFAVPTVSCRRGAPRPSVVPRSTRRRACGCPVTCSISAPRPVPARRCGSTASASAWRRASRRMEDLVRRSGERHAGRARSGSRSRGRSSASRTSAPWCSWHPGSTRLPATSCSRSPRAPTCRATSASPSAKPSSCGGRSTPRSDWSGSSTTRRTSSRSRRHAGAGPAPGGDRARARVLRVSGDRAPRARRRRPHARAGTVVALVGENGAGKTTLVKLLCRFYEPTAGRMTVDGLDLARLRADEWRERALGRVPGLLPVRVRGPADDRRRRSSPHRRSDGGRRGGRAGRRGRRRRPHAATVSTHSSDRRGTTVSSCRSASGRSSRSRGFMRERPLLCVLDEPTAALDAETEHALFERFAAASREASDDGRITVLVSHRFSTVRMADLIVVLDGARVAEVGSHEELGGAGGLYAELYACRRAPIAIEARRPRWRRLPRPRWPRSCRGRGARAREASRVGDRDTSPRPRGCPCRPGWPARAPTRRPGRRRGR